MAFCLLSLAVFIMFVQPVDIFPQLITYSPVRNSMLTTLAVYVLTGEHVGRPFLTVKENVYFLIFTGLQVLSVMVNVWFKAGIDFIIIWLLCIIPYYIIVQYIVDEKQLRTLCFMIVLAISYLSYWSLTNFVIHYEPGMRAGGFGWYSNSNDLSMILVPSIALLLMLSECSESIFYRYIFIVVAGFFSFNLLFTGSRGGLMGLLIVGGLSIYNSKKMLHVTKMIVFSLLLLSIIGMGIKVILSRSDLNDLSGDASSEDRITQWKAGIKMTLAHPLLGVGPDEFQYNVKDYGGVRGLQPHNTIVKVFGETGIPGGIFFLLFCFRPLRVAWKFFKTNQTDMPAVIMYKYLLIALIGFWACAVFSNRDRSYILYILLAMVIAIRENIIKENKELLNE